MPKSKTKSLYWLTTRDHHEDCFVVSHSKRKARSFFENYEGYDLGEAKAKFVCGGISKNVEEGYAQKSLLKKLGFRAIIDAEEKFRIYHRGGENYVYGNINYSVLTSSIRNLKGVYLIRCSGSDFYKVGLTINFLERLRKLQTGNPYRLFVYAFIPHEYPRLIERKIHDSLIEYRTQFEWYEVPETKMRRIIAALRKTSILEWKTGFHEFINWAPP